MDFSKLWLLPGWCHQSTENHTFMKQKSPPTCEHINARQMHLFSRATQSWEARQDSSSSKALGKGRGLPDEKAWWQVSSRSKLKEKGPFHMPWGSHSILAETKNRDHSRTRLCGATFIEQPRDIWWPETWGLPQCLCFGMEAAERWPVPKSSEIQVSTKIHFVPSSSSHLGQSVPSAQQRELLELPPRNRALYSLVSKFLRQLHSVSGRKVICIRHYKEYNSNLSFFFFF